MSILRQKNNSAQFTFFKTGTLCCCQEFRASLLDGQLWLAPVGSSEAAATQPGAGSQWLATGKSLWKCG